MNSALHYASAEGHLDDVRVLVRNGADIDGVANGHMTPLLWASSKGHLDVVEYLISEGAQVDKVDNEGSTPLHYASLYGHLDVVKYFLTKGVQVDQLDSEGRTPLFRASKLGYLDVVQYLVSKGAQTEKVDKFGFTPRLWALTKGHPEIAHYFTGLKVQEKHDKKPTNSTPDPSQHGQVAEAQPLPIDQGAHRDNDSEEKCSPLQSVVDAEEVTDTHILNLSKLLGVGNYSSLCVAMGMSFNRSRTILVQHMSDYSEAFIAAITEWRNKSTRTLKDLDEVLEEAEAGGFISQYKKYQRGK